MAGPLIVRLTAQPRLLSDGTLQTVRMAGGGRFAAYNFGGVPYRSGVMDLPRFSAAFGWDDNGWNGGARPQVAALSWAPSLPVDLTNFASLYMWKDAPITAELGTEPDAPTLGDGPELLTAAPTTYAGVSWNSGSGVATCIAAAEIVRWSGVLTIGQTYHATFNYNVTSGSKLRIGNGATNGSNTVYTSGVLSGSGTIDVTFVATGTFFGIEADTATFSGTVGPVSCRLAAANVSYEPPSWSTILTGTVQAIASQDGKLVFTIADNAAKMDKPLATGHFTGGGNIEGPAEAEGRDKRRSYGYVFNVEGRILDKANNIWEFGDPAFPLQSFVDVKDMGRSASPALQSVAWQGSIGATLAALQLSNATPGSGVVAASIACVKWWTQPQGPLTADMIGSGDYGNTACALAKHIAIEQGMTMNAVPSGVSSLMGNTANAGLHVGDDRMTAAQALDRLLLGAGIFWRFSPAGALDVLPIAIGSPVVSVRADNIQRQRIFLPHKKRRIGYKRNERQHSDGEISAALLSTNPDVLTADEKIRWLAGQDADMEGRYSLLRARAVALGISVSAVDTQRNNWRTLLGSYSPPWNDTTQDSLIYATVLPTALQTFSAWGQVGPPTMTTSGVYTVLGDDNGAAYEYFFTGNFAFAPTQNISAGITIQKALTHTTNWGLLRTVFRNSSGTGLGFFDVAFNPYTGALVAITSSLAAGSGSGSEVLDLGTEWFIRNTMTNAPATTAFAAVELYPAASSDGDTFAALNVAGQGTISIRGMLLVAVGTFTSMGRPELVGRLNAYSAQLTALNKAISEVDGLTSIVVTGPPTITIQRDAGGVVKTGQLPALANYTAKAGNIDYTSLGTWSVSVVSGTMTASSPAAGQASVNTFSAPGKINVNFSYGPISRDFPVDVKAQDDPPTTTGGGGGTGGTTVNTTTLGDTTSNAYDFTNAKSAKLTCKTGSVGRIDLTASLAFRRVLTNIGSTGAAGKFRWRVVAGSYADVATEQLSSADSDKIAGEPVEDGYISVIMAKTGLSANTDYEIEFDWRQVNTSGTASTITRVSGVIQAVGS